MDNEFETDTFDDFNDTNDLHSNDIHPEENVQQPTKKLKIQVATEKPKKHQKNPQEAPKSTQNEPKRAPKHHQEHLQIPNLDFLKIELPSRRNQDF